MQPTNISFDAFNGTNQLTPGFVLREWQKPWQTSENQIKTICMAKHQWGVKYAEALTPMEIRRKKRFSLSWWKAGSICQVGQLLNESDRLPGGLQTQESEEVSYCSHFRYFDDGTICSRKGSASVHWAALQRFNIMWSKCTWRKGLLSFVPLPWD